MRRHADGTLLALVNINEREQRVGAYVVGQWLEGDVLRDLVSGEAVRLDGDLLLEPYRFVWLAEASQRDQTD